MQGERSRVCAMHCARIGEPFPQSQELLMILQLMYQSLCKKGHTHSLIVSPLMALRYGAFSGPAMHRGSQAQRVLYQMLG